MLKKLKIPSGSLCRPPDGRSPLHYAGPAQSKPMMIVMGK